MSTLTESTVGLGFVNDRAEEGKQDQETMGDSKHGPYHPSGGMKLIEQQTERLDGNHLCNAESSACGNTWTEVNIRGT
jgi:hypothetical protein